MSTMQSILFTKPNTAELIERPLPEMKEDSVLVKTLYSTVSAGTERANLVGEKNISGYNENLPVTFPRQLGYSSVGTVQAVGPKVASVRVGDRVISYFGKHNSLNMMSESSVMNITDLNVSMQEAALAVIAGFPMLGIRRTRLEMGESALVMGLGILGLIGVQLARIAGAVPVIAADLNPKRRALALEMGADAALDPRETDFVDQIKRRTNGGAKVVIEVTGAAPALDQALRATAPFGRVSLLGCTRQPIPEVDFYHRVHATGVELIGTNNFARAKLESRPGNWTWQDDCRALLQMMEGNRLHVKPLIGAVYSPKDAPEVYHQLAFQPETFPIGVLFDWSQL